MLSSVLNTASRSARARRAVESVPVTRRVVDRFVAGEGIPDAVMAAKSMIAVNRMVTIDVLGEDVFDVAGARGTRDAYIALLYALFEADLAADADVSLKLSALGQAIPGDGETLATDHAREICAAAEAVGATVTLDMESHATVDSTLAIGDVLRADYPWVGNVLQSNLKRTGADIADLSATPTRVRLVKGAYKEPTSVAFQRKAEVDEAYTKDITALMRSACYPMIATHDPAMLELARTRAKATGHDATQWEAQMLYGVRTDLQRHSVEAGEQMRVYIPFGSDWYGYFMRRLAERPANVAFFLRAMTSR